MSEGLKLLMTRSASGKHRASKCWPQNTVPKSFPSHSETPDNDATTPPKMICGMTAIGTTAIAVSSDFAKAEMACPSADPVSASKQSVPYMPSVLPGGSNQASAISPRSRACSRAITAKKTSLAPKYASGIRLKSRSRT